MGHTDINKPPVPDTPRSCVGCQRTDEEVTWELDPYDAEIHEELVWRWYCTECRDQRADDI
jgi:hypothetical protein